MHKKSRISTFFSLLSLVIFFEYMKNILEWNEKINVTNITDEKEFVVKHFIDSLTVLDKIDKSIANIYYVSEKNNYAIIYCDLNKYKSLCAQLSQMPEVTSFEDSLLEVEKNSF